VNERDDHLLNDLLDGRLSAEDATALRARIAAEAPLRERYEALVRVGDWLREEDPARALEAPATFLEAVAARIATRADSQAASTNEVDDAPSRGNEARGEESRLAIDPADPDAATNTPPGGRALRLSDAAQSGPTQQDRPPALRFLGFAYAAAALVVVGLGVGFVLMGGPGAPPATDLAKHHDGDDKPGFAENSTRTGSKKEQLTGDIFQGPAQAIGETPKVADRRGTGSAAGGGVGGLREEQLDPAELDMGALKETGRQVPGPVAGPGGSVPPNLRQPSNDPAPSVQRAAGGRKARGARRTGAPAAQPPVRLYAVHAEDPAAARAGLQLLLYQIAQAEDARLARSSPPAPASKPLGDAEAPAKETVEGDSAAPLAEKRERSARPGAKDADVAEDAHDSHFEIGGGSLARAKAPTFVLRRLDLASLDKLFEERAGEDPSDRLEGEWGPEAAPRAAPVSGTPPPASRAPVPPAAPQPAAPTAPGAPADAPATRDEPAPPSGASGDGPGPTRDENSDGLSRPGLADGVVDRVLTLGQLRALEARFGIRAQDVRILQPSADSKQDAQGEQTVRVRFVFVRGPPPR
jgi:hypothetical protein